MKHFTKKEWAEKKRSTPSYIGKWEATPFDLERIAIRAGNAYDLFMRVSIEADSYRLAHIGSYDECMEVVKDS